MQRAPALHGELVQFERPDWRPLTSALGTRIAERFMWMHEISLSDQTSVHAYKHLTNRRYLYLSGTGISFAHRGGDLFVRIPLSDAVARGIPTTDFALLSSRPPCVRRTAE